MRQLHEMLWYLMEVFFITISTAEKEEFKHLVHETESLTQLDTTSLIELNINSHREKVNVLLQKIYHLVRTEVTENKKSMLDFRNKIAGRWDFIGFD